MAVALPAPIAARSRVPGLCAATFVLAWTLAAIEPRFPRAWMLENLPVFAAVPLALLAHRSGRLSDRAWMQVTAFMLLHVYGSHYTYANTPLGFHLRDALHLSRNHYDRIAHFAFGLLFLRPMRELLGLPGSRARALVVSVGMIGAASLLYEQLEWITATIADPAAGIAFLGVQGDVWDAQKDATCASVGSIVAVGVELLRRDELSRSRARTAGRAAWGFARPARATRRRRPRRADRPPSPPSSSS